LARVKLEADVNFIPINASFNSMQSLNGLMTIDQAFRDQASTF